MSRSGQSPDAPPPAPLPSAAATALYEQLVRAGGWPDEAAGTAGGDGTDGPARTDSAYGADDVNGLTGADDADGGRSDAAVAELVARGLAVRLTDPPRLVPVAPVATLGRSLADATAEVAARQQDIAAAYREAGRLQRLYVESQLGWELSGHVAVLRGDAVTATVTRLIRDARVELLHLNTAHYRRPPRVTTVVETDPSAPDLRVRSVYAEEFLRFPDGERTLRLFQQRGEEVRVSDEVPMKLYLADGRTAVVPLLLDGHDAALLLRDTELVRALRAFFELLWDRATPWRDADDPAEEALTPVQRRILELLAAGFTDDRVAASLGVTTRTVRRHVAAMLARLGAPTRFAAAVAARRRGWL